MKRYLYRIATQCAKKHQNQMTSVWKITFEKYLEFVNGDGERSPNTQINGI